MHRRVMASAIGAIAIVALSACGSSGGSGDSAAPGGSGAPVGTLAADSQLRSQLPADVRSKGSLVMATDATIGAPFATFGSDNKTVVGLNVDIANAIGQLLGIKIDTVNTPFGTFIPGLQSKRYDFSVSVMLDTKEREQVVDFVDYIKDGSGFLVRSDDPNSALKLSDLCGMKAAAISGSVEQQDLEDQTKKCKSAGKAPIAISIFAENAQGVLALTSGRVDVWVGDSDQNAWLKQQNNGTVKQSGVPFNAAVDGMAIVKGSPLVPVLQKAMQALMDNGTYKKILAHYGVQGSAITKATLNDAQY
jgi:polar amino acid transport system substrate-binding protein